MTASYRPFWADRFKLRRFRYALNKSEKYDKANTKINKNLMLCLQEAALPLPLGEVAEQSEAGEGEHAQSPSQSAALTAHLSAKSHLRRLRFETPPAGAVPKGGLP